MKLKVERRNIEFWNEIQILTGYRKCLNYKTMKKPVYIIINIICQVVICWMLVILNAFYNDLAIPISLAHSSGAVWLKIFIAIIQGLILVSIIYASNRLSLSNTDYKPTQKSIDNRTFKIQFIVTSCFIIGVILS
ncbi:hypothetical protein ABIB62_002189 [Mucilaginibacter sp. UYP25]